MGPRGGARAFVVSAAVFDHPDDLGPARQIERRLARDFNRETAFRERDGVEERIARRQRGGDQVLDAALRGRGREAAGDTLGTDCHRLRCQ